MLQFEPIDYDFDQTKLFDDLIQMNIFSKSFLATVIYNNGRSKYDQDGFFEEYEDVVHYDESPGHSRTPQDAQQANGASRKTTQMQIDRDPHKRRLVQVVHQGAAPGQIWTVRIWLWVKIAHA